MKSLLYLAAAAAMTVLTASAKDDAPRGYTPISELKEAQAKAAKDKKLIVVLVKGADDSCPHCANAKETGEKAVGSGVVQIFVRAEAMNKADASTFPAALQERAKKKFSEGSSVTMLVFTPDMSKLIAEGTRKELDENKDGTAAFKKAVADAKKELK